MNTNNEINVIKNILTESFNTKSVNENLSILSKSFLPVTGAIVGGSMTADNPDPEKALKGIYTGFGSGVAANLLKNKNTRSGLGRAMGTGASLTGKGVAALARGVENVGAGAAQGIETAASATTRQAGKAARIVGQTAKTTGDLISKGVETALPVAGRQAGRAAGLISQGTRAVADVTGEGISKAVEKIAPPVARQLGRGVGVVAQGAKQTANTIRFAPGSLTRGLAGGVGGLVAGAVTSPIVRKGLEAVGVENETVKDVADTVISGGVGSAVGAALAGGSVAGAAAAGAGVPAAAIAGWQAGRQIGNRIGAGDASKTAAYEQTKEKGWWDLAKGMVGMDDESIRQKEIEAEGKKAEERQKEFFANRDQAKTYGKTPSDNKDTQRDVKNATNIGGIQTGLRDFYTKPR